MNSLEEDGIELARLILEFANRKDLSEHVNIFFETREALLILNSAEAIVSKASRGDRVNGK